MRVLDKKLRICEPLLHILLREVSFEFTWPRAGLVEQHHLRQQRSVPGEGGPGEGVRAVPRPQQHLQGHATYSVTFGHIRSRTV
eukprot:5623063-Pyramimonas_sp.AAC.1